MAFINDISFITFIKSFFKKCPLLNNKNLNNNIFIKDNLNNNNSDFDFNFNKNVFIKIKIKILVNLLYPYIKIYYK